MGILERSKRLYNSHSYYKHNDKSFPNVSYETFSRWAFPFTLNPLGLISVLRILLYNLYSSYKLVSPKGNIHYIII